MFALADTHLCVIVNYSDRSVLVERGQLLGAHIMRGVRVFHCMPNGQFGNILENKFGFGRKTISEN